MNDADMGIVIDALRRIEKKIATLQEKYAKVEERITVIEGHACSFCSHNAISHRHLMTGGQGVCTIENCYCLTFHPVE
jgi:Fe-S cluster assembly ATPase SufC